MSNTELPSPNAQNCPIEVDIQTVHQWMSSGDQPCGEAWFLVDCREPKEFQAAKIEGAILIPMSQWMEAQDKLLPMQDKHVVVHCHHGGRSLRVAQWLRENGFPTAQSMAGGIDAWSITIDPTIARY